MIPTSLTVDEIVGDSYGIYLEHLENYKKSGLSWYDYANRSKISPSLRREFARILALLHEHGFYGPEAINGRIECYTLTQMPKVKRNK